MTSPMIDTAGLVAELAAPQPPLLLDVRWRLTGPPGRDDYRSGHIPGAVFVDLDADLCGPPGPGGRHPLPDIDRLGQALRAAGVRTDHPVVVYDGGDGLSAARLWWTLRWSGHLWVRTLNGGYRAWLAAGGPVELGERVPPMGDFVPAPGQLPVLAANSAARLADADRPGVLIDVRAPERYRGETEPIDPVAGHIPGAVNLPISELFRADGTVALPEEIRDRLTAIGVLDGVPMGAYCGSGVTAAAAVLALTTAGIADVALYVGSWSEWITDPTRPIATG